MPLKLNVGLSKKIGQPDYGSLGASCHVELELDSSLLAHDLEMFQTKVRDVYIACRQAVEDELARCRRPNGKGAVNSTVHHSPSRLPSNPRTTPSENGARPSISPKQLNYVRHLGSEIQGVGTTGTTVLAERMFGKPLTELTSFEGSSLIDQLKAIKTGQIKPDELFKDGAAA